MKRLEKFILQKVSKLDKLGCTDYLTDCDIQLTWHDHYGFDLRHLSLAIADTYRHYFS